MTKRKVLYVISLVQKSMVFEWTAEALKDKYDLSFILLNPSDSPLESFLRDHEVKVKRIPFGGKKNYLSAFVQILFSMIHSRPDVVHAHLLDAQLIGLTAAWIMRIKKRIYTRHNSNYHHVYHSQGVKYDRWSNAMATHIVSISQATDKTLFHLEQVPSSKVVKIPHGFELKTFDEVPSERIQTVRRKWNIPSTHPVVGVIARHIEWKGLQFIIPAFKKFINIHPAACLVLANATGPYEEEIKNLLVGIPVSNVVTIPFEEDIAAVYKCFTIYVHAPVDELCEAFGQTYVEALAAGVPSVFTLSGIAQQFIEHDKNAYVAKFKDSDSIYNGLEKIWSDKTYSDGLVENGKRSVFPRFGNESVMNSLAELYNK